MLRINENFTIESDGANITLCRWENREKGEWASKTKTGIFELKCVDKKYFSNISTALVACINETAKTAIMQDGEMSVSELYALISQTQKDIDTAVYSDVSEKAEIAELREMVTQLSATVDKLSRKVTQE